MDKQGIDPKKDDEMKVAYYSMSVKILELVDWILNKVFEYTSQGNISLATKLRDLHKTNHELYEGEYEGKNSQEMLNASIEQMQFLVSGIIKIDEAQTDEMQKIIA